MAHAFGGELWGTLWRGEGELGGMAGRMAEAKVPGTLQGVVLPCFANWIYLL